jgi:hypothetical protein
LASKDELTFVRLEVLMAVKVSLLFWVVVLCGLVGRAKDGENMFL